MGSNEEARVARATQLPEDVLMEILSTLRVKDLVRFKSVCKAWNRIISSNDFIRLHLKKSSVAIRHRPLWLIRCNRDKWLKMRFLGSCDGLVCQYNGRYGIVYIWNPATRRGRYVAIVRPPQRVLCSWFGHVGKDIDECKLILVTTSQMHLIRLYSDNGGWKSTQVKKRYGYPENVGTLFNGTVHWPAYDRSTDLTGYVATIVSYDLGNEKIGEISAPPEMINSKYFVLKEVHGCLSALFGVEYYFELWVMKEYGVEGSWTRLMVLSLRDSVYHRFAERYNDEREVVLDDPALIKSPCYGKIMYVESLASPAGSRNI